MRAHAGCRRRPHPTGTREAARRTRTSPSGGVGEVGEAGLAHTTTSPCKLGLRGGKTSPHYVPSVELFRVRVRARVAAARESAARRTQGERQVPSSSRLFPAWAGRRGAGVGCGVSVLARESSLERACSPCARCPLPVSAVAGCDGSDDGAVAVSARSSRAPPSPRDYWESPETRDEVATATSGLQQLCRIPIGATANQAPNHPGTPTHHPCPRVRIPRVHSHPTSPLKAPPPDLPTPHPKGLPSPPGPPSCSLFP